MVVIPADPDNYTKNDKQFNGNESVVGVVRTFKKIFSNLNILLLDNRIHLEDGIKHLENTDIIYLLGGNPFIQLKYLQRTKFDNVIRNISAFGITCFSKTLIQNYIEKFGGEIIAWISNANGKEPVYKII